MRITAFLSAQKSLPVVMGRLLGAISLLLASEILPQVFWHRAAYTGMAVFATTESKPPSPSSESDSPLEQLNRDRPSLLPAPKPAEIWECEVVVVGGSLGGVAAAAHAMQSGATTCLIELAPWLGGQISSQGVSALDQSLAMRDRQNFSPSWQAFKDRIRQQPVELPAWSNLPSPQLVEDLNRCWVSNLCFPPKAGATAALQQLQAAANNAPDSQWLTSTAFKGAEFDQSGRKITAIYGVHRIPKEDTYVPLGRPSQEIASWYAWQSDQVFEKVPIRLQAPEGKELMVIDATDTGELIGWAGVPYRLGSDSKAMTGESNSPEAPNPDCTQAFTFPFVLTLKYDRGVSLTELADVKSDIDEQVHLQQFDLEQHTMFKGESLFQYRRIISRIDSFAYPSLGDMTLINWNRGNDWNWMNPPLILTEEKLIHAGQHQNWMGGLSTVALQQAETHALIFARWLMENHAQPKFPLSYLSGPDSPLGTQSGLSMMPYIREGRRILGRPAYGQEHFMIREQDLRIDMSGGRDFSATAVGLTHYAVDIHGCRYRDGTPSGEAGSAPAGEQLVRPTLIPLESLIPRDVDNLLVGGKGIAATHIANASIRIHYGEWSIGAAAGATAGWLITEHNTEITPADIIPNNLMESLQQHLVQQGLRFTWRSGWNPPFWLQRIHERVSRLPIKRLVKHSLIFLGLVGLALLSAVAYRKFKRLENRNL